MKLKVFTDYACPFCYIGYELVKKVTKEFDIDVEYYFMEIHPEVPEKGCPTKDIVRGDLAVFNNHISKLSCEYGINPKLGDRISNSKKAIILRGYVLDKYPDKISEYDKSVYETYLVKNLDISNEEVLGGILLNVGIEEEISVALNNTMANIKFEMDRSVSKENYIDMIPAFVIDGKKLVGAVKPEELASFIKNI